VGVDRHRRTAGAAALKLLKVVARDWLQKLEFTASLPVTRAPRMRRCLKNQRREHQLMEKKFLVSLNIGFFLCYFRRRLGFVGD
jgi:hypothetical protein